MITMIQPVGRPAIDNQSDLEAQHARPLNPVLEPAATFSHIDDPGYPLAVERRRDPVRDAGSAAGILLCRRPRFGQAVLPQDRQDGGAGEGTHPVPLDLASPALGFSAGAL